ncbi:MAG: hypothetical protein JWN38_922 [Candidatus Saccharibacteria bacterium]|nr:hypothetical protein [Candidatus Saccharibacteria bacterium]
MPKQIKKRTSPTKQAKLYAYPRLKISHHRHSWRLLPRAQTSYPMLTMILLLTGVFLGGMSYWASALNASSGKVISATIYGPPPTVAATIDNPSSGQHFAGKPVTISGSCPTTTYVIVQRNGLDSGSALCADNGTYSLQTDLFSGANNLVAKVFNNTNLPGPDSGAVKVYYDPPAATPSISTTSSSSDSSTGTVSPSQANDYIPLALSSDYRYSYQYVNEGSDYQFNLMGGKAPYDVLIDWGDKTNSQLKVAQPGLVTASHTYDRIGGFQGSFVITYAVTDSIGTKTILQSLALVSKLPAAATATPGGSAAGGGIKGLHISFGRAISTGNVSALLHYILPTYGVVVLMVASFWLGERRELGVVHHFRQLHAPKPAPRPKRRR